MSRPLEIRIHGRGGQGNVVAAYLFAAAAIRAGFQAQACTGKRHLKKDVLSIVAAHHLTLCGDRKRRLPARPLHQGQARRSR